MNRYSVDVATLDDVSHVVHHMRADDVEEVRATYGADVDLFRAVRHTWRVSRDTSFVGYAHRVPICVFGLDTPCVLSETAIPWFVATDELEQHAFGFLRHSSRIVRTWSEHFPVLSNYVYENNKKAIRWLQWLGFEIYSPEPYGALGLPFHKFERRYDPCA